MQRRKPSVTSYSKSQRPQSNSADTPAIKPSWQLLTSKAVARSKPIATPSNPKLFRNMKTNIPIPSDELITASYLRAMLSPSGEATHIGELQNAALCSRIRNNGEVIAQMDGQRYSVMASKREPAMISLYPLVSGLMARHCLTWGHIAFSDAVASGQIKFV